MRPAWVIENSCPALAPCGMRTTTMFEDPSISLLAATPGLLLLLLGSSVLAGSTCEIREAVGYDDDEAAAAPPPPLLLPLPLLATAVACT